MNSLNIITIIQARMGSSRLPGKVLMPLVDAPLLQRMVERVLSAKFSGRVIVATSENEEDKKIVELCELNNFKYFTGHPTDLLDRHYQAVRQFKPDAVVKIPSDCPLIDPKIIDEILRFYIENTDKFDFVSNLHPASYPDGNDVEVVSFPALEVAWKEADKELEREHTTPFIWERPERFRIGNVLMSGNKDLSSTHRWTIDYKEDYLFIKTVYEHLYYKNHNFGMNDILRLLEEKPELQKINEKYAGRYWYENHLDELKNIDEYKSKLS